MNEPTPRAFPGARRVAIDLPPEGAPILRDDGAGWPNMVAAVAPLGSSLFDAHLFLVHRHAASPNVARLGAIRGAGSDELITVAPAVADDPELPWRLWERGTHPGDIRLGESVDRRGRGQWRTLLLLNFTGGLDPSDELTLPLPLRRALAQTMALSPDPSWRATAKLIDRGAALRRDQADEGREQFTLALAQAAAMEEEARKFNAPGPAMRDFRFAPTEAMLKELEYAPGVIRVARPDVNPADLGAKRLAEMATAFRAQDLAGFRRLKAQLVWMLSNSRRLEASVKDRQAGARIGEWIRGEGRGPGASFFRDLVAQGGMIETLEARLEAPAAHQVFEATLDPLKIRPDERLVELALDPAVMIRVPRTVQEVKSQLTTRDASRRLKVLALDDTPLARGKALAHLLVETATNGHAARLVDLHERTERLADVLREQERLGSRDPAVAIAAARLERGAAVIDAALESARRLTSGRLAETVSGRLEEAPVRISGSELTLHGRVVLGSGGRLAFRVTGERAKRLLGARPGDRISLTPDEVSATPEAAVQKRARSYLGRSVRTAETPRPREQSRPMPELAGDRNR